MMEFAPLCDQSRSSLIKSVLGFASQIRTVRWAGGDGACAVQPATAPIATGNLQVLSSKARLLLRDVRSMEHLGRAREEPETHGPPGVGSSPLPVDGPAPGRMRGTEPVCCCHSVVCNVVGPSVGVGLAVDWRPYVLLKNGPSWSTMRRRRPTPRSLPRGGRRTSADRRPTWRTARTQGHLGAPSAQHMRCPHHRPGAPHGRRRRCWRSPQTAGTGLKSLWGPRGCARMS